MRAQSFLLETLSHYVRGEDGPPPGVPARVDAGFETSLAATCVDQRIAPIVSRSLEHLALPPAISPVTAARLRSHASELHRESERRVAMLTRVVARLTRAGVDALVCGEALSASYYPHPALRHISALELLIDERDTARALEAAAAEGFTYPGVHPVFGHGRIGGRISHRRAAELVAYHHYFAPLVVWTPEGDALRLRFSTPDIGPPEVDERVWDRRMAVHIGSATFDAISREDHLLDTAVVAGITALAELPWVVDLSILLRGGENQVDWEYIQGRARLTGVHGAARYALRHACRVMSIPGAVSRLVPSGLLAETAADAWWRPDSIAYGDLPAARAGRFRFGLLWCGGPLARARWLWRHVAPRRRWVRNRTGSRPDPWAWLKFVLVVRDSTGWTPAARTRSGGARDNVYPIGIRRGRR